MKKSSKVPVASFSTTLEGIKFSQHNDRQLFCIFKLFCGQFFSNIIQSHNSIGQSVDHRVVQRHQAVVIGWVSHQDNPVVCVKQPGMIAAIGRNQ